MNAIKNVFAALANVAASLNALASVVDCATGKLRQQLALDEPAALTHGEVIDNNPAPDGNMPTAKGRNGRKPATV